MGSSPAHDQNFFCAGFFRLGVTFFSQNVSKGSPFIFFSYFAKEWMFKNSQRPPFYIFRQYATDRRPTKISKKNPKKSDFFQFFPHAGSVENT